MRVLPFERSGHDRVVAGACGGLASTLGVDATLVRLVFALLSLAGGAGILLYFALWSYDGGPRTWPPPVPIAPAPRAPPPPPRPSSGAPIRRRPVRSGLRGILL